MAGTYRIGARVWIILDLCLFSVASAGRIEIRTAQSNLGVNRRHTGSPIDPRVVALSLIDESGKERGPLFQYSCHLTVLGVENYQISADWLGPVRQKLQEDLGMPVMYLQGAEGNVDPVGRGVLAVVDPDQAMGSSFEVLEQLAEGMIDALRIARTSEVRGILDFASKRLNVLEY